VTEVVVMNEVEDVDVEVEVETKPEDRRGKA